jgi:hypothetical protein
VRSARDSGRIVVWIATPGKAAAYRLERGTVR